MTARETVVPVLLEKVYKLIQDKLDLAHRPLVTQLAQHLFSNVSHDDLTQRNESDLYGAVVSLWHHINEKKADEISVRVFNPTVSRQGWQSTHTIVEIVVPDSPFLVDSVKMALTRLDLSSHLMLHNPTQISRSDKGSVVGVSNNEGAFQSLFHIEVDRLSSKAEMTALKTELLDIFTDTGLVVNDWLQMVERLEEVTNQVEQQKETIPVDSQRFDETLAFLRWLGEHNFTFMGYKEYDLVSVNGDTELQPTEEQGLGLFANSDRVRNVKLSEFSDSARLEAKKPYVLIVTKGNTASRIHRPAYNDYIGIKKFDKNGKVIGEHRFTGLYTSAVYNQTVETIPLVREKVERILDASGYRKGSYSYKALHNILENYPRDELLQAREEELLEVGTGVVQMQDRDLLRLFVRKDPFGRFFSCMVYVTKDRYNTELRRQTQRILKQYFGCEEEVEFTTYFSESPLARTHYIVRVDNNNMDVDVKTIEQNLMEVSSTWDDRLSESIVANFGESKGLPLSKEYMRAFPRSYKEDMMPGSAVADIERLEALSEDNKLGMLFYRPQEEAADSKAVRLKLFYHSDEPIHLSDVMPMLENFGLRVIGESPYEVRKTNGVTYWILDFSMLHKSDKTIDLREARDLFQQAFAAIWAGELDSDGFNRLVLGAGLSGREISILRAYARYMRQVGFPFSQQYIEDTLSHYPDLAKGLVSLFGKRFDPKLKGSAKGQQDLIKKITEQLDHVESLDDDRIIRRYMEMITATLRTNYYQLDDNKQSKPWLALKMRPSEIPDIPAPVPAFEIFVYAPDIEGVHLRGGKVARGGLRWSDRQEDFRTEILGLVKAQQVKNTVIVPVGAKGGFVCKRQHMMSGRDEIFAEGQRCYKRFIRALLDVSDNIIEGEVIPPKSVVRHDEDDPYLVVAADKGTATFSDLANSVSDEYNFWLGDAFASGGSNGYDHKAMGITAKGGWESVKRHFREMGINCQTTDFTAIGVGDMAGDVFGNGMLLSKHIRMQAAFNHMHIFIDPNPESASSWVERERLFNLPRSSWEDYNKDLISQGGGIFSRRAKSIPLTPEIQKMLGTKKASMAPNDLIKSILSMQVDLLWNGGIGTYVKSSNETHTDVGDRANDVLRIDGRDLKAKVVGEGGNLGMTQLGRIEYALTGGRVNTDFVDNVGGVDCSDNEVNIKIFLNGLVSNGDLTVKQRNQVLESMEDEVGEIVLDDAYCQAESISVTEHQGVGLVKEQIRFIHTMEKAGYLDRGLEYIPDDETLLEREKQGQGLTRPELSVLVAYGKMVLKEDLVSDDIANDEFHAQQLMQYFPTALRRNYSQHMDNHPLRSEIIATALANQMVNEMGCNFVTRLQEETGANIVDIANAYAASREIYGLGKVLKSIRELDNVSSSEAQYELIYHVRRTLRRLARWLLRNRTGKQSVKALIELYQGDVLTITEKLDENLVASEVEEHNAMAQLWIDQGVNAELANSVARLSSLYSALDISTVARETGKTVQQASKLYFNLGDRLSLHWFLKQINGQAVDNNWQALARAAFREDLDWQQRQLTGQVLNCGCASDIDVIKALDDWMESNSVSLHRWESILNEFKVGSVHEFAKFSVALRELMLLNLNCMSTD
ncbi:NAD-glutamate dehydrogenase [Vibrio splendidus]|uniref:NAD-glutamate dehydrogenase n=1 Tax=Vibrio splendidus TaxID=29497 RepID=UPI0024698BC6|nr:NAD-glutamate dehydrogenase [Vibrio splendidus]MDH5911618.1 NAD-glutamate dehydrogenase [Vibrio splendidus]MDH5941945.1 NAD-glutamate dehydrogenase [Vibrio splendidus]MDH5985856.1 NAD-glutamate dehydrogenase [Vibrio splendidus]MDH5996025.1 NAD-glutamate dehydrogenase [Vibrio splendidus]MDH6007427.1 NAD-glutamate dehydrogenase [Vibrio splendidus]